MMNAWERSIRNNPKFGRSLWKSNSVTLVIADYFWISAMIVLHSDKNISDSFQFGRNMIVMTVFLSILTKCNSIRLIIKRNTVFMIAFHSNWKEMKFYISGYMPDFCSNSFPGSPYQIFLLYLLKLPCHFYLIIIKQEPAHREILLNQPEIRLYLPFPDWFETQTDVSICVRNQSENGKYNLNSGWLKKISKRFHCVHDAIQWNSCALLIVFFFFFILYEKVLRKKSKLKKTVQTLIVFFS